MERAIELTQQKLSLILDMHRQTTDVNTKRDLMLFITILTEMIETFKNDK
jgi:hypothetical protein